MAIYQFQGHGTGMLPIVAAVVEAEAVEAEAVEAEAVEVAVAGAVLIM